MTLPHWALAMIILLSLLLPGLLSILPRAVGYRCLAKQGVARPPVLHVCLAKITIQPLSPKDRNIAKNFLSKGLSCPNLQPGKLKCDWVLDMVICCAHVYLGSDNQPGWWSCGDRFVKEQKEDLRLKDRLPRLTGVVVDHDKGKPGLGRVYCRIIIYLYR